jgi:UDP-N-acetylmuramoyl-tripeptide--D-alanyl-D-alanine ligase
MRESLKNFATFYGKKIAILGDMLEMGEYSRKEHEEMLKEVENYSFEKVFLVGKEFYNFREKFNFIFFENLDNIHEHFLTYPVNDYLILLKGSRGIALERLKEVL